MAFPTTGLLDDFAGAAGADANFTEIDGTTSFTGINYDGSGSGQGSAPTTKFAWAYYNASTYGPDCECYVTVSAVGTAANAVRVGARIAGGGTANHTGYYVAAQLQTAAAWTILRHDVGANVTLATGPTQAVAVGDQMGIEIAGTVINAWYRASGGSWSKLFSYDTSSDSTKYSAAGNIGVEFGFHTSKLDDFNGGTTAAVYTETLGSAPFDLVAGSLAETYSVAGAFSGFLLQRHTGLARIENIEEWLRVNVAGWLPYGLTGLDRITNIEQFLAANPVNSTAFLPYGKTGTDRVWNIESYLLSATSSAG